MGLACGSAVAAYVFGSSNLIKVSLAVTLLLNAVCLTTFTMSTNFYLSVFLRSCIGFFQVFVCIFQPVWVDLFGPESQKSVWLTVALVASPLGIVIGYGLTYAMIKHLTWEWSFYI